VSVFSQLSLFISAPENIALKEENVDMRKYGVIFWLADFFRKTAEIA